MGAQSIKTYANVQSRQFKEAMEELSKNKHLTLGSAEKAIGLEADFTEQVARGIKELTLKDVIKIAKFFDTTMESVLAGGHSETRIPLKYSYDVLASQYFKECVDAYIWLLDNKCMNFWIPDSHEKRIQEHETKLEAAEQRLMERFKTCMEEMDRQRNQSKDAARCCDEVLINELAKRGYKVEKGN